MELCVSLDVNFKQCGSAPGVFTPKFKIKHLFTIIQRGPGRKNLRGIHFSSGKRTKLIFYSFVEEL